MPKIKLADKTIQQIKDICATFEHKEGELLNVLHQVQGKLGYLPAEVQEVIANELNTSVAKVYGVVTFYSFFTMIPQGENPYLDLYGHSMLCSWGRTSSCTELKKTIKCGGWRDYP